MGKIILNGVDYSAANNSSDALSLSGGRMDNNAAILMNGDSGIGTNISLNSGSYCNNIYPAETSMSYGTTKKIYTEIGGGANHPSITITDKDTSYDYDENVKITSSSITITDNSISDVLRIYADKIMGENTILCLGSNNNGHGLMINCANKTLTSGLLVNENYDLGTSNRKYKNIYAINGTIQTSDRTRKTDINNLETQKAQAFINGLTPVSYKMIDGTSGRTHYGFIAQDIEELMNVLSMDSKDFAGFIKSPKKITKYEDENGNKLKKPIEEVIEGEYDYSLRYDEFIAPLIKVVQEQQKEIERLKEMIAV